MSSSGGIALWQGCARHSNAVCSPCSRPAQDSWAHHAGTIKIAAASSVRARDAKPSPDVVKHAYAHAPPTSSSTVAATTKPAREAAVAPADDTATSAAAKNLDSSRIDGKQIPSSDGVESCAFGLWVHGEDRCLCEPEAEVEAPTFAAFVVEGPQGVRAGSDVEMAFGADRDGADDGT